ncbi:tRNA (adenosine(37)-N6)-dimethylallyltransferase MiaA [Candidatus Peregrinibacteria bacterium CG11_big_fil_rev_8_21_14_0_20_46_8]|nr:MAG: tRNA (adenosine(37)-N6)-dimethylallyltransferase MiaA [Candidatus Peregrinibacteria bacterium CG11_big_fil_rev_8_21_14_0_20_46_8]
METTYTEQHIHEQIAAHIAAHARPLLVILGPTASGKTGSSIELAQRFNGEIISADSRQVYRHMDIGTAKITEEERAGVPHHLLDVVDPDARFTVSDFKRMAEAAADTILARGKVPILVGGTGLYIDVVTRNFVLAPENPEIRARLQRELDQEGPEALHARLAEMDPDSAAKFHPNNTRYVVRALEIAMTSGSAKRDEMRPPKYDVLKVGYVWEREKLYERIDARAEKQVEHGLFDETAQLLAMGYSRQLPSMSSLGYRESLEFLDGEITREQALALIQKNCRNYARRQMTWFKRYDDILWVKR